MIVGKVITVLRVAWGYHWLAAKKGDVWRLVLHGTQYSATLRDTPPRIRLLEDVDGGPKGTRCELLDPWPEAPEYFPHELAVLNGLVPKEVA